MTIQDFQTISFERFAELLSGLADRQHHKVDCMDLTEGRHPSYGRVIIGQGLTSHECLLIRCDPPGRASASLAS